MVASFLIVVALASSGEQTAPSRTWTATQLQQRVVEDLTREGVPLSRLGLTLEIAEQETTQWSVTLTEPGHMARTRVLDQLPNDIEAAIAELVPIVTTLVKNPSASLPKPNAAHLPDNEFLEKKFELLLLASRETNFGLLEHPVRMRAFFMYGTLASLPLEFSLLALVEFDNEPVKFGLGLGGAAVLLSAIPIAFSLPETSRFYEAVPNSVARVGIALWASSEIYSKANGFRVEPAIAASALVVASALDLAIASSTEGCSDEHEAKLYETAIVSNDVERRQTFGEIERCGAMGRRRSRLRWLPETTLLLGTAGVLLVDRNDIWNFNTLVWALFPHIGAFFFRSSFAENFLDKVESANLPLEISVAPTLGAPGLALHGRF